MAQRIPQELQRQNVEMVHEVARLLRALAIDLDRAVGPGDAVDGGALRRVATDLEANQRTLTMLSNISATLRRIGTGLN